MHAGNLNCKEAVSSVHYGLSTTLERAWEPPLGRILAARPSQCADCTMGVCACLQELRAWACRVSEWGKGEDEALYAYSARQENTSGMEGMIACPGTSSSPVLSFLPTRPHSTGHTEVIWVLVWECANMLIIPGPRRVLSLWGYSISSVKSVLDHPPPEFGVRILWKCLNIENIQEAYVGF